MNAPGVVGMNWMIERISEQLNLLVSGWMTPATPRTDWSQPPSSAAAPDPQPATTTTAKATATIKSPRFQMPCIMLLLSAGLREPNG